METVTELICTYPSINLNNYDKNDVETLFQWASKANDELWELHVRICNANKSLSRIQDIAEEV